MNILRSGVIAGLLLHVVPTAGKTVTATMASLNSVFQSVQAGDTIKLEGTFSQVALDNRTFATALKIDASKAVFTNTLIFTDVSGVSLTGGTYHLTMDTNMYGKAISVVRGENISFDKLNVDGDGFGQGVAFSGSHNVKVSRSTFTRLKAGVTFTSVNSGTLSSNNSVRAAADGFDIADSHKVSVNGNNCSGTDIGTTGNHPDCVQLWSIVGHPVQSDISITGNVATGATQGFTDFDPAIFSGERITIHSNIVDTSFPQGIACYGCFDSTITDNTVTTLPGAASRTSINIIGGARNTVSGNTVGAKLGSDSGTFGDSGINSGPLDPATLDDGVPPEILAEVTNLRAVPEPGTWALLIAGFALTGSTMRRVRSIVQA